MTIILDDITDDKEFVNKYRGQVVVIGHRPYTVEVSRQGSPLFYSVNGLHYIDKNKDGWVCYSSTANGELEDPAGGWKIKLAGTLEEASAVGGIVGYLGPMCYDVSRKSAIEELTEF